MVVKFFANKKGGSSKAIDYLLNHREKDGTARVLQGDPQLTREIINSIQYKQKTTVGVLSFEEANLSEELKYQLMADFEKHLLPGLEKEQYNILWVEHRDKGRLELNFVIPKIELTTQKSLNPYYHKADLPRVEKWQDLQNLTHNFSNPKDPSKERNVEINSCIKKFNQSYEQLNETIQELVRKGQINNREQLIELLKSNSIEVTRTGKDYISVKLPDSKKARKFKEGIYSEQFTSIGEIETISQRAEQRVREYNTRDTQAEQHRLKRELIEYTQHKERDNRKKYSNFIQENGEKDRRTARQTVSNAQDRTRENAREPKREAREREQNESNINRSNNGYSEHSNNIRDNIPSNGEAISGRESDELLFLQNRAQKENTKGELRNDSTREPITPRATLGAKENYTAYTVARETRTGIFRSVTKRAKSIRTKHLEYARSQSEIHRAVAPRISCDDEAREGSLLAEARENIRAFNGFKRFTERVREAITTVSEKIIGFGERFRVVFEQKEREKQLKGRETEQERRAAEYVSRIENENKIEKEKTKTRTHTRRNHHHNDNDWGMTL